MSGSSRVDLANAKQQQMMTPTWKTLSCLGIGLSCSVLLFLQVGAALSQPSEVIPNAASPTESPNRPILKSGSRGAEVTELQATLKLLGYYSGVIDGFYGQTTVNAVSQFQQLAGLSADGVVGPATWNRLFPPTPELPSTTASPIATRPPVAEVPARSSSGFPIPSTIAPEPKIPSAATPRPTNPAPTSPVKTPTSAAPSHSTPSSSDPVSFPTLRLGAKGPAVVGLQERLRAAGVFNGVSDGVFGPETQAAVKAAQRKFNLDSDGVVGPATWAVLLR